MPSTGFPVDQFKPMQLCENVVVEFIDVCKPEHADCAVDLGGEDIDGAGSTRFPACSEAIQRGTAKQNGIGPERERLDNFGAPTEA
jgi:hypothetical protein